MGRSRRRLVLAPLALAGMIIAGGLSTVAAQEATPAAGTGGTIEVNGTGEAEADAVGAVLQFILRAQFDNSGEATSESDISATEQPEVTREQVNAVVKALEKAGVPKGKIGTAVAPEGPYAGQFGYGAGVVAAELDAELLADIETIVDKTVAAGEATGVTFDPINVAYAVADCAGLEHQALADAVADAQEQAAMMAEVLGVSLGSLIKASKQATYGSYYAGGPTSTACDLQPTLDTALTTYLSAFDPVRAGEVEVYSQVLLSYEIDS
jgi:uncharacterized protein YggE